MTICPHCHIKLQKEANILKCSTCKYQAIKKNGILFFNPEVKDNRHEYKETSLDNLFKYENTHFWFKNRKDIIKNLFKKNINKTAKIIDIGSGTGNIPLMLKKEGYSDIAIGELHKKGLEYAKKSGINNLYQFDINQCPFKEHFYVVSMFDVLEHLENDEAIVRKAHQMLKNKGQFILTVPAHQWLWSNLDKVAGHKKRYNIKELTSLIKRNGFKIKKSNYFFFLILPLIFIRSLLNKKSENLNLKKAGLEINPLTNGILNIICQAENIISRRINPPTGGSIILLAEKI